MYVQLTHTLQATDTMRGKCTIKLRHNCARLRDKKFDDS